MHQEDKNKKDFRAALTDPVSLYEHAPCGYLSFLADGRVVKVNQTLLGWLGFERAEIEEQVSFKDLISRGGKVYYEMFYMPLLQLQPHVNEISFDFIRKDGSKFPALVNSRIFSDENGKMAAVNATVTDITDRKKYESELLAAKRSADSERTKFELLSDFIPEMVFTADAQGQLTYVNQRFSRFFRLYGNDISSRSVMSKVHKRDRLKLVRTWKQATASGKDFLEEVRLERQVGIFQWHLLRAVPLRGVEGKIEKWMGSCTDIDRHITAIQHLDEFISVASHELKTPITSLRASLQLMERLIASVENPKLSLLMGQANRNIDKINNLVEDLLNTGNIKEGQMVLHKKNFRLWKLLSETCQHVKLQDKFKLHLNCEEGITVFADEHKIDQVLVNFVNNAVKYAPNGKDIFISAKASGNMVRVEVKDTGPGIAKDKLPFIFERYYRVKHDGDGYSGLGLGLYICSEIVKRHGGDIGVESGIGEGSTFWFTLPIAVNK